MTRLLRAVLPRLPLLPPSNLLRRAHWLMLLLTLVNVILVLPRYTGATSTPLPLRVLGASAMLAVSGWWIYWYQRGYFPRGASVVEGIALFIAGAGIGDPLDVLRVLYIGVGFRALYGTPAQVALRTFVYLAAHFAAAPFATQYTNVLRTDEIVLQTTGFPLVAATMQVLAAALTRHEQAETALRASESRFRLLSAAAPVGIFQTDSTGRCVYANERCQSLIGHVPGIDSSTGAGNIPTVLGTSSADERERPRQRSVGDLWSEVAHPEDREVVVAKWQRAVEAREEFDCECRVLAPDGTVRWLHVSATAMLSETNDLLGYVGTADDVTQRKLAQTEHAEKARLDGALLVARTVAHEINNALGPVLGYAELVALRPSTASDPTAAKFVRLIGEAAEETAERVRRLQGVIRLEETTGPLGSELSVLDIERSTAPSASEPATVASPAADRA